MNHLQLLVDSFIIGLAAFAVSKFVVTSILIEEPRAWLIHKLAVSDSGGFNKGWRAKLVFLIGCEFCCGFWVSAALAIVVGLIYGFSWPILLAGLSGWGIQTFLAGSMANDD